MSSWRDHLQLLLDSTLPFRVQDLEGSSDHILGVGTWSERVHRSVSERSGKGQLGAWTQDTSLTFELLSEHSQEDSEVDGTAGFLHHCI